MRIKTVSVTYGRKINLGDYNSAELGLSLWADLDDADSDAESAVKELQAAARELVRAEYMRIKQQVKQPANGRIEE